MKIKKIISIFILFSMVFSISGCYSLLIETPENQNIKLMYSTDKTLESNFKTVSKKRFFYLFWGLLPIGTNSTADMLKDGVKEVIIVVKADVIDILIGMLTGGVISSQTVTIETSK